MKSEFIRSANTAIQDLKQTPCCFDKLHRDSSLVGLITKPLIAHFNLDLFGKGQLLENYTSLLTRLMSCPLRKNVKKKIKNQAQAKGLNKISDVEQRQILMQVNSMGLNESIRAMESFCTKINMVLVMHVHLLQFAQMLRWLRLGVSIFS